MTLEGWRSYKLGNIAEFSQGIQVDPKDQYEEPFDNCVRFIRIVDYSKNGEEKPRYIRNVSERYVVEEDDLVMIRYGSQTAGQIARGISGAIANNTFRVVIDEKIFSKPFLYYYFNQKSIFEYLRSSQSSSTMPAITFEVMKSLEIFIPESITEQSRIASILSSLDDKIELNLQMNKTLEAIVQAIFKEWFMDFRFPGFDGELIDGLPKGWRIGKLNQVAKVEIGRTPPRMENQWFSTNNGDVKWISIRDLGNSGIYILDTSEYLTSAAIEKFRIPIILSNTVVLSFKLTIGRVAITTEKMLSNEAIAQIRSDTFDSGFIYCLLKNYNFDSLGSTSSIATAINSKIIKEMEVQVPEQKVVCDFCKVIEPLFAKIKSNSLEIKTLTKIREVLLPKLMTGKIRVA